jgi:SAM-dependent methyltransferase
MQLPFTFNEIVEEIIRFTSLPRKEVEHRVWMQAIEPGWNVLQDVARFRVTPFVDNKRMAQLYENGDGFIFETLVFWAKPDRYRWSEEALKRVQLYAKQERRTNDEISILIFGDGAGNDSLYFASNGFRVDYFDVPGSVTFDFALKRFEAYGYLGHSIRPVADYRSCLNQKYDIVISFEVLEHLSQPLATISDISFMLKSGGIALITEDFGDIVHHLPTHLKSNSKYLGQTPFIFLKNKMLLSWYSNHTLFKPMEFVKVTTISLGNWLALIRDFNVRSSFLARYSNKVARFVEKLAYVRT